MLINDKKKLKDIQQEFGAAFPGLKIEFYQGQHRPGEGSPVESRLDNEATIGAVRTVQDTGDFKIHPNLTVADFEHSFQEKYGLNVQVMRRSGNIWMQTTATDSWTLAEQNRKGGSSEEHFNEKYNS